MIFLESPWPILFIGIVVEAVLAITLLRTGRGYLLWVMIGVAVLVVVGLVVERLVVTEQEAVENTLDAAVDAVRANDLDRLLECISPTAEGTRADARWMLNRVEVQSVYIRDMEIKFNHLTSPPTAKVRFQAIGQGRDRMVEFPYGSYKRAVTVELRLEGDRWLVTGYDVEGLDLGNLRIHGLRRP